MQVVYQGHNDVLLTDYNGRRFAFRKGVPRDVPQEVFSMMKASRDAETEYLRVVEQSVVSSSDAIASVSDNSLVHRKRGRPRKV